MVFPFTFHRSVPERKLSLFVSELRKFIAMEKSSLCLNMRLRKIRNGGGEDCKE
jgi:hypothetical protein